MGDGGISHRISRSILFPAPNCSAAAHDSSPSRPHEGGSQQGSDFLSNSAKSLQYIHRTLEMKAVFDCAQCSTLSRSGPLYLASSPCHVSCPQVSNTPPPRSCRTSRGKKCLPRPRPLPRCSSHLYMAHTNLRRKCGRRRRGSMDKAKRADVPHLAS